jgi:hypothetical protein
VFVISPTVHVDPQWSVVKKFAVDELGTDLEEQPCFFDHWDDRHVENILEEQKRVIAKVKELRRQKKWKGPMPQILARASTTASTTYTPCATPS